MEANNKPQVDDPCTRNVGSDRYASKILSVSPTGHKVTVEAYNNDGQEVYTLRRNGIYRPQGSRHGSLTLGEAVDYRDPSF
jgi:hypothetical protein